jgi:hypothetical protein
MIYKTGAAFRQALEDRLLAQSSRDRVSLVRLLRGDASAVWSPVERRWR